MITPDKVLDFEDVMSRIRLAFTDMSGRDIAVWYNKLINPKVEYIGNFLWEEEQTED